MGEIELITTGSGKADEGWRRGRLNRVVGYAMARLGLDEGQAAETVRSLEDRKGSLTVSWRTAPTAGQRKAFEDAWEAHYEPAESVAHA